eukprot:CAMPEP_0171096278 /NCGR_PEP_ID=MMETSP0766_2-20121228/44116_1 /TAXON_ID=439317 /ORGANISM="Gambierdiscus australes, Strain CAWD 149" /LENGTH=110 /DNA_ID=CAMNT_0011555219 /DNA_START=30 /DNA_END=360 /DNA_ORIENTATION=+
MTIPHHAPASGVGGAAPCEGLRKPLSLPTRRTAPWAKTAAQRAGRHPKGAQTSHVEDLFLNTCEYHCATLRAAHLQVLCLQSGSSEEVHGDREVDRDGNKGDDGNEGLLG